MTPLEGYSDTFAIETSQVPEAHPTEILALLWTLFGPDSRAESHDISKILDRLIASDRKLERDRRLQWLEQRYLRYD